MREQMPHRRAFGPGRLVEVDHALLRGDQRRERRDELRHGCPAHHLVRRPRVATTSPSRTTPAAANDARPALDLPKCFFHRRAILDAWLAGSSLPARPTSQTIGFSRAVRDGRHVLVAGTCAVMPDGGDPARRRVRPGAGAASRSSSPRSPRRAPHRSMSCAREPSCSTPQTAEEVGRAHGEVFRRRSPGEHHARRLRAPRSALAGRDRGRRAAPE